MSNIYAKLEEIAKRDFPKISGEAVSKIVRETVRETEDLCNEGLANDLVSDPSSVLKLLKEPIKN